MAGELRARSRPELRNRTLCVLVGAVAMAGGALAQDALRGKMPYHDIGLRTGAGVSCIDCHGGIPGGSHGIGKAAGTLSAIEYALATVHQMAPLRGRVSAVDLSDLAAYLARPNVPSPDLRVDAVGSDGAFTPTERLTFGVGPADGSDSVETVRLANGGTTVVRIRSEPALRGPEAARFAIIATDCAAGRELAGGQACTVSVAFRPDGAGRLSSASLGVEHDWLSGGTYLALIGRVVAR